MNDTEKALLLKLAMIALRSREMENDLLRRLEISELLHQLKPELFPDPWKIDAGTIMADCAPNTPR